MEKLGRRKFLYIPLDACNWRAGCSVLVISRSRRTLRHANFKSARPRPWWDSGKDQNEPTTTPCQSTHWESQDSLSKTQSPQHSNLVLGNKRRFEKGIVGDENTIAHPLTLAAVAHAIVWVFSKLCRTPRHSNLSMTKKFSFRADLKTKGIMGDENTIAHPLTLAAVTRVVEAEPS